MKRFLVASGLVAATACTLPETVDVEPLVESIEVRASRTFAGPTQFPPSGFAGYGILAFPLNPARDPERFSMFCSAYLDALVASSELEAAGVEVSAQMVTVMPINSDLLAEDAEFLDDVAACDLARDNYGLVAAQDAIRRAEAAAERTDGISKLDGRGPFLLAWSPGANYTAQDALVLVADLSDSSNPEQALTDLKDWTRDIQAEPGLWRRGWNIEGLRKTAQRWVDRRGAAILKLIGGFG